MQLQSGNLARTLERVVAARGRLLQAERVPVPGPAGGRASSALRLVFDVGVVTVRSEVEEGDLKVEVGVSASTRPEVFVPASEEEPWWMVMGCPLARVEDRAAGGVRLQFRADHENPRRIEVFPGSGGIQTSLAS
jgi:hypothetical protein